MFGKRSHVAPTFCSACGRQAVRATVLDFDAYSTVTGKPVNPKVLDAAVCESVFDRRRRGGFAHNFCVAEEWSSGKAIGHRGGKANRLFERFGTGSTAAES